jgi:hypothetical protein
MDGRTMRWVALALLAACSDGGGGSAPRPGDAAGGGLADAAAHDAGRDGAPVGTDAAPGEDAGPRPDAGRALDAARPADAAARADAAHVDAAHVDAAPPADAVASADSAPADARVSPDAGRPARPRGQCVASADCPSGDCNERAPGGICFGVPCPDGTVANFGACQKECGDDADCPLGLRCNGEVCLDPRCAADADCDAPYVCRDGLCARPLCPDGACPAAMRCARGTCVEAP